MLKLRQLVADLRARIREIKWMELMSLQLELRPSLRAVPYWVAAVLVGMVAVIYSASFSAVILMTQRLSSTHPYYFLALAPLAMVLSSWCVARFAPAAGGTGVPQVTAAIQLDFASPQIDATLNLRVAIIVMVSSLLAVVGGGGLGREGPMVHISACVFYVTARQFSNIWPYQEHRSWIVAGGAAGIAAAFNTPLAGIVFVLEELAQQHFHQFKTVVISAVIMAGMIAQWLSGRYLFLGYPRIESVSFLSVPYSILVGLACGFVAGIFDRLRGWLDVKTAAGRLRHRLWFAWFVGVLVCSLAVFVDMRVIGGGIGSVQELLFTGERASWGLLLGRFAGVLATSLAGVAGGFLAPALAFGAAIGSKVAWLVSPTDHNLLVMVGMAGFLSAMTRAPFTALVIVMEMTDRHSAIFPLMITSLIALGVNRLVAGARRL